ncbi:carbohydrate kinase [Arthrobacter agilis]|uniref:class I mannose-6-phosphate isomerase n=1 Tax=Arthrobacter agilis TaxID=37921 RepID=UPI000B3545D4|nr:carbohydrate kinase [Arthrobacter agilis]OUM45637.1 carbohydrate kinase [Arthrobacter agilis]PPB47624.1 carbohydrate kinase [Arthrobacter agilis]TPV24796.1 carbohydrate kinase [Arthrobacter agilis]VDR30938.1 Probable mannose-6-phosphate isomerase gmuF [Arthrobacter agilis]
MIERLHSNRPPERFYRGGSRISSFRGEASDAAFEPEDWIGSTTTIFGEQELGLTRLADRTLLRDAVAADPAYWLGTDHAARWDGDVRLLVKLLDAGQRLPVHAHPDDAFAVQHLGHSHGKAEAWYILSGGTVHLGLTRDVGEADLARLVEAQDVDVLLGLLHEVPVTPGNVVLVPPGVLHAIGEGVLLLELQQPEDLSILLEWRDFALDGAAHGHLGLGFELALTAVDRRALPREALGRLVRAAPPSGSAFPPEADAFFRLERVPVDGPVRLDPGFAVLVVTGGPLALSGRPAPSGSTWLVPAGAGPLELDGAGEVLVARPPRA